MPAKALVIEINDKSEYQRLLTPQSQSCGMKAGRVYLAAGQACGQHSTNGNEETLVFLSGCGELIIGSEQVLAVGEGKVAYISPRTIHDVKNTGKKALIYVYCLAPAALAG